MNKNFYLLFVWMLLHQLIFAQTRVGGGIFSAETWTVDASPYLVTADVVVFPDASLNIEAGTEIRFASDTKLELRGGNLFVNGTADAPIVFTLDSDNPADAIKWSGIEHTEIAGDSNAIVLEHGIFEYAKTAINYGSGFYNRSINDCIFRFNDRGAFDGAQGYNWVTIRDSEFIENGVGMEGRMSAINCTFTNNRTGFGNPMTFGSLAEGGGRVTDCTFTGNDLAVGSIGQIITIAVIENSFFDGNGQGHFGYWANIDRSTFIRHTETGVMVTKGNIQRTNFAQNSTGLETSFSTSELNIHDNVFTADTIAIKVGDNRAKIIDNTFCDAIEFAAVSLTNKAVDLNQNCWCSNDLKFIETQVFDAFDDVSLGIVSYANFNQDCIPNLVFPGDTNNDGVVNTRDVLSIGLAYAESGAARPNATTNWVGQASTDWSRTLGNSVNAKHTDANGDGFVDEDDMAVVLMNYNQQHNRTTTYVPSMAESEMVSLILEISSNMLAGEPVEITISLPDATQIDDLYGIAFALESDKPFFKHGTMQFNPSASCLREVDNTLMMTQEAQANTSVEIGLVKRDRAASICGGMLGTISFTTAENLSDDISFRLADVEAITSQGLNLEMTSEAVSTVVSNTAKLVTESVDKLEIIPNPASDFIRVTANDLTIENLVLFSATGQEIRSFPMTSDIIPLDELCSGWYILMARTDEGVIVERFLVE
ncbi:MAG: T9SS type A sorting domain-containing protein [Bacteroidota bacterium]